MKDLKILKILSDSLKGKKMSRYEEFKDFENT